MEKEALVKRKEIEGIEKETLPSTFLFTDNFCSPH